MVSASGVEKGGGRNNDRFKKETTTIKFGVVGEWQEVWGLKSNGVGEKEEGGSK